MKSIDAATLGQQMQDLVNQLDTEDVLITHDGAPVAKLTKIRGNGNSAHLIGSLQGKIEVFGDIYSTGVHYPEDCHKYNRDKDRP